MGHRRDMLGEEKPLLDGGDVIFLVGIAWVLLSGIVGYYISGDILVGAAIAVISGFLYLGLAFVAMEFLLWYNTKKEYERNPYDSALIGRYHFGIDSEGKRTGRPIMD